jgi:hypothetical protein
MSFVQQAITFAAAPPRSQRNSHVENSRDVPDLRQSDALEPTELDVGDDRLADIGLLGDVRLPQVELNAYRPQQPADLAILHRAMMATGAHRTINRQSIG